jgi:Heterokaryon incompatibility protein (HET)
MAQSNAYDISTDQWSKYSGFKPLRSDRSEIRLLRLEKGADANRLRYVTCHADLGRSPEYSALSYSWGSPVPGNALKEIFIHGESVAVRPILSSFLEIMASQNPGMDLWIDALCINQSDVKERNRQISIMGEIYKTAQLVYVWLGPGDDDTNYAMEHIKDSQPRTRFDKGIFSASAEKLLRASYWTRRWVIQEFALAQELTVVCGAHQTK